MFFFSFYMLLLLGLLCLLSYMFSFSGSTTRRINRLFIFCDTYRDAHFSIIVNGWGIWPCVYHVLRIIATYILACFVNFVLAHFSSNSLLCRFPCLFLCWFFFLTLWTDVSHSITASLNLVPFFSYGLQIFCWFSSFGISFPFPLVNAHKFPSWGTDDRK